MDYFCPHGECISVFDVCHAYQMLEANYNVDGWLRERPSNRRRRESIGCQLSRIGYSDVFRTVDLWATADEVDEELQTSSDDESVRFVYFQKVLEWGLPTEEEDIEAINRIFAQDWLAETYPDFPRRL